VSLNGAGLDMAPDPLPDVVFVNQALSEPLGFEQVYPNFTLVGNDGMAC
jgi:hypothetical protein